MSLSVTILPADLAKQESVRFTGIDRLSFIDNESHGPSSNLGITDSFEGKQLVVASPNVAAVLVESG